MLIVVGGDGGLTRPIPRDEGGDQLSGALINKVTPRDETKGLEW